MTGERYATVVFMAKPGHALEWQAIVLAASWRYHFGYRVGLHVFVEHGELDRLQPSTLARFQQLGVVLRSFEDRKHFLDPYPIGNKIVACTYEFPTRKVVFCDTDMVILRKFDIARITGGTVAAAAAGAATWARAPKGPRKWAYLYRRYADCPVPPEMRLQSGRMSPPYYNAGLVAFDQESGFGQKWLEIAIAIDGDPEVPDKRPWLDQIALPIAIRIVCDRSAGAFAEIDAAYNWNPDVKDAAVEPVIAHYHRLARIRRTNLIEPISRQLRAMQVAERLSDLTGSASKAGPSGLGGLMRKLQVRRA